MPERRGAGRVERAEALAISNVCYFGANVRNRADNDIEISLFFREIGYIAVLAKNRVKWISLFGGFAGGRRK